MGNLNAVRKALLVVALGLITEDIFCYPHVDN